jgi:hypothetical protein
MKSKRRLRLLLALLPVIGAGLELARAILDLMNR